MIRAGDFKKGQVSVWIILAIFLVVALLLFLLIRNNSVQPSGLGSSDIIPDTMLKQCVYIETNKIVDIVLPQGGFISPKNYAIYNGSQVEYLCLNIGLYDSCIQQHPLLIREIKSQLIDYLNVKTENCFAQFEEEVKKRGGSSVSHGPSSVDIDFIDDKVVVKISKEIDVTDKEITRKITSLDVSVQSPIFNLANVAMEIANQEAKYCNFETAGYSLYYPRYNVKRQLLADSTRIYIIRDEKTGKIMMTAIKGCVIPPGV